MVLCKLIFVNVSSRNVIIQVSYKVWRLHINQWAIPQLTIFSGGQLQKLMKPPAWGQIS